ncbi:MAG: DNA polymerase III subunit gamma/tau [Mycoplasmatales bacterium]
MARQTLYRKYRPNTFAEVKGQELIVKTLLNAIKNEQVAHAYLFNGTRGTGKTSIAKIFAKSVNCYNLEKPLCGECDACLKFQLEQEIPDIYELDAASNNGVDEIRNLIDNVKFLPLTLKYKVYIIDEVHMLSKGAFNALLKTLEEPPKHAIFILATTEVNKIPLTILSRCQRFDFRRIEKTIMINHLKNIFEQEAINYDDDGVESIAKLADGSMRDALSLSDKVIASGIEVTEQTVVENLQIATKNINNQLLNALLDRNVETVLQIWHQLVANGIDELNFVLNFQYYLRDLLLEQITDDVQKERLIGMISDFAEIMNNLRTVKMSTILVEIKLIEMCKALEIKQPTFITEPKFLNKQVTMQPEMPNLQSTISETESISAASPEIIERQEMNYDESIDVSETSIEEQTKKTENLFEASIMPEVRIPKKIHIDDILEEATKNHKNEYANLYFLIKDELEAEQKYGLAKFFELSKVQAASPKGCIIIIDDSVKEAYLGRVSEIQRIFMKALQRELWIELLGHQEWQTIRREFLEKKTQKENGVLQTAIKFFGEDKVRKK